jgi:hypothetical protein
MEGRGGGEAQGVADLKNLLLDLIFRDQSPFIVV